MPRMVAAPLAPGACLVAQSGRVAQPRVRLPLPEAWVVGHCTFQNRQVSGIFGQPSTGRSVAPWRRPRTSIEPARGRAAGFPRPVGPLACPTGYFRACSRDDAEVTRGAEATGAEAGSCWKFKGAIQELRPTFVAILPKLRNQSNSKVGSCSWMAPKLQSA